MTGVQSETGVLAGDERMLIDGELQHTGSGATFDVIQPASEEVASQATDGTVGDMERAIGAAMQERAHMSARPAGATVASTEVERHLGPPAGGARLVPAPDRLDQVAAAN